ncbi:MAG: DEAD/DEAH box helicase [Candidatus Omnitrophica bacterium]|nr:DEAD/DEAH box helicase [Candidatus Omnitrophota bacterium]
MNTQLIAAIFPDATVHLEWTTVKRKIYKNTQLLQKDIFKRSKNGFISCLLFLGFCDEEIPLSPSLNFFRDFAHLFSYKLSHTPELEIKRDKTEIIITNDEMTAFLEKTPFMVGSQRFNKNILNKLWEQLNTFFQDKIKHHEGTIESFIQTYSLHIHLVGRMQFHIAENLFDKDLPFSFLATYTPRQQKKKTFQHFTLKNSLEMFNHNDRELLDLLNTINFTARECPLIKQMLESGDLFHPLAWTATEAYQFLQEIKLYEKCGVLCRIPDWWNKEASSMKINISMHDSVPSHLGMDSIMNFNAELLLGDTIVTEEEIQDILNESEGLAFVKGKWLKVDQKKLAIMLKMFEKAKDAEKKGLTFQEAIRLQMGASELLSNEDEDIVLEFSLGQWLKKTLEKLRNPEIIKSVSVPTTFVGTLRPYQLEGLNWLSLLHSLQFGACLADDMGLGKTVQLLAFLTLIKDKNNPPNLLILPASLVSNWQNEIEKFAPNLNVLIAHPGVNPEAKDILNKASLEKPYDLVITTYNLIQKFSLLKETKWFYVILDEAQAIKNPNTKQSKSIKKLYSFNRIILTGTPIENKLSNLWSLLDFTNPGLLGTPREFSKYTKSLSEHPNKYGKLKSVIQPYLLRRLKTDKNIISDLPDKIEMKTYSHLSKKQIILYNELIKNTEISIKESKGIQRKGIILSSLMKFKQICNHPSQYTGNRHFSENDSGKFQRLREICEIIFQEREKVLIFTQFKSIISPLEIFLKTIFGRDGLVLHGSIPTSQRKKLIERFKSDEYIPFFILSLKAGGVGLNLTEANHVIHFDRWWNPAIENQATDRAFRIGQEKKVIVHKFITKGTIEENIDLMIEEKSSLSNNIIERSKENWITEIDNDSLINLFKLKL